MTKQLPRQPRRRMQLKLIRNRLPKKRLQKKKPPQKTWRYKIFPHQMQKKTRSEISNFGLISPSNKKQLNFI